MSSNPEEMYRRQKQLEKDHKNLGSHSTVETWHIEQGDANQGQFVPDPMDKMGSSGKKPNLFTRIRKAIFKK